MLQKLKVFELSFFSDTRHMYMSIHEWCPFIEDGGIYVNVLVQIIIQIFTSLDGTTSLLRSGHIQLVSISP